MIGGTKESVLLDLPAGVKVHHVEDQRILIFFWNALASWQDYPSFIQSRPAPIWSSQLSLHVELQTHSRHCAPPTQQIHDLAHYHQDKNIPRMEAPNCPHEEVVGDLWAGAFGVDGTSLGGTWVPRARGVP